MSKIYYFFNYIFAHFSGARLAFPVLINGLPRITINGNGVITVGSNSFISEMAKLEAHGGIINIGKNVFINRGFSCVARDHIQIGDGCFIGEWVSLYDHNHFISEAGPDKKNYYCSKITIGKGVWIGNGVFIAAGSDIGDYSVIGANVTIKGKITRHSKISLIRP